jgi:hypothetical protein
MKMKSIAMLAASGLLAASIGYSLPALADDATDVAQATQSADLTDDNGVMVQADNSNSMSTDSNSANAMGSSTSANASTSANGADQGSADTATGDDDY